MQHKPHKLIKSFIKQQGAREDGMNKIICK